VTVKSVSAYYVTAARLKQLYSILRSQQINLSNGANLDHLCVAIQRQQL